MFGQDRDAGAEEGARCSAKDCRNLATVDLSWRNPSLHDRSRVKHWFACPEHEQFLADFLTRRSFLLSSDPVR